MKFNKKNLNRFLFFKLPSAWWCGVRATNISSSSCEVRVKHKWFNQNPFNSMYFAVQAMAAELSTGVLVMREIRKSNSKISMLVKQNNSEFTKKAKGVILFTCNDGEKVKKAIEEAVKTGEGQTIWLSSEGLNSDKISVSKFNFEWTVKVKK